MGELDWVRKDDPVARTRAQQELAQPAAVEAVIRVNLAANDAIISATERIMGRTNAIESDAVFRQVVPHSQDLINDTAQEIKGLARDATDRIRRRASGV